MENQVLRIEYQESSIEDRVSRIKTWESRVEDRELRAENRFSRIKTQEWRDKNRESRIEDRDIIANVDFSSRVSTKPKLGFPTYICQSQTPNPTFPSQMSILFVEIPNRMTKGKISCTFFPMWNSHVTCSPKNNIVFNSSTVNKDLHSKFPNLQFPNVTLPNSNAQDIIFQTSLPTIFLFSIFQIWNSLSINSRARIPKTKYNIYNSQCQNPKLWFSF